MAQAKIKTKEHKLINPHRFCAKPKTRYIYGIKYSKMIKRNLVKSIFIALFFAPVALSAQSKHLFILSGQSNMAALNPKHSFIPTVSEEFGTNNVIVVKHAIGGKPIRCWFDDWVSIKTENKNTPNIYNPLMAKVKKAIKNETLATITFVWMQGERDARESRADEYATNLTRVYNQIVRDLDYKELNMVIGRLSDFDMSNKVAPHWTKMREVQVGLAATNQRFDWINTDDLNEGVNFKGKAIQNDLHMSVEGYKTMGTRFAQKAIELIHKNN